MPAYPVPCGSRDSDELLVARYKTQPRMTRAWEPIDNRADVNIVTRSTAFRAAPYDPPRLQLTNIEANSDEYCTIHVSIRV